MGFIDKIRAYLNEEDAPLETDSIEADSEASKKKERRVKTKKANKPKSTESSKRGRWRRKKGADKSRPDDSNTSDILKELNSEVTVESERESVKDFCEQLVDVSYHMEDMKREYQMVTSYLTDIQRIEELPIHIANDIMDTARKIEMLDKNRQTYLQSESLLSMESYNKIASLENDVVDTIKKLNEMEIRDSMLKSDMSHLEGEKEDLKYMRNENSNSIFRLRGIIITILVIFLIASMVLLSVAMITKSTITVYALVIGAVAVISFAIIYARYIDLKSDIRDADTKLKRAVSLLNKVKVKFINNTNTLDYVYEKFDVSSSKELEYQWQQYNTMVKDARRYSQANSDFRVYCDELVSKLAQIGLKDPLVWPKQTTALIDRREMVEIKHSLNVRRQKIREKLTTCDKIKVNAQTALRAAIEANSGMESYITEILASYHLKLDN